MKLGIVVAFAALSASCSLIASVPEPTRSDADADGDGEVVSDTDAEAGGLVVTGGIGTVSETILESGSIQVTDMGFEWGARACDPTGDICVWGGITP